MTPRTHVASAIFLRELRAYFLTPQAWVFIAVFLLAAGAFGFEVGRFFDTNRVDLAPFFFFHPWLQLVFLPAVAMRLWADEIRGGTMELLLTLPAHPVAMVAGKFLAAWTVAGVALLLTTPAWLTANYLGEPDNAAIALAYVISFLMAGMYVALGSALSAITGNQIAAFVLSVSIGFVITAAGLPVVSSGLVSLIGPLAADMAAAFSPLGYFETAQRGVLEARGLVYLLGMTVTLLAINTLVIAARTER